MKKIENVKKFSMISKYSLFVVICMTIGALDTWANDSVPYKTCTREDSANDFQDYAKCFSDSATASLPFIIKHATQTEYVAVLTHGLSDSPYYFKDIAAILYDAGFNVVAPRLAGHGTKPEDLINVKSSQWQKNVADAVKVASTLGKKIVLGGFSTGGALSIDYNFTHPEKIQALLLFSPATEISNVAFTGNELLNSNFGKYTTCGLADLADLNLINPYTSSVKPEKQLNPIKYENIAYNGPCQLSKVIVANLEKLNALRPNRPLGLFDLNISQSHLAHVKAMNIPVFMAISEDDKTINFSADLDLGTLMTNKNNQYLIFRTSNNSPYTLPAGVVQEHQVTEPVSHSQVPLEYNQFIVGNENVNFSVMRESLKLFISKLTGN